MAPARGGAAADAGDAPGDPLLEIAWSALEAAGIRWAPLRGHGGVHDGDIDLLVAAADVGAMDRVLAGVGFHRLAAIGHGQHRFHRAFAEASGRWLTLDTVTELAFGPGGWLVLGGAAASVLDRRLHVAGKPRLSGDDAFWALLLHALLDRGRVSPEHGTELGRLVVGARPDGPLGSRIDAIGGAGTAARLLAHVAAGSPDRALGETRRLRRRWLRADPGRALGRRSRHAVLSRLRKPHTALRRRGIDVAVLGPDGAGKSTLAASLARSFPMPTRTVYLGLYGAGLDRGGHFGFLRRVGRLWRGWSIGAWHRLRGRLVVYDRHALDALIAPPRRSAKARLRRWLLLHAIPRPALVIVLDAPAELLFARKGEHDVATIDRQRQGYLALAARLRNAEIVDVARDAEAVRRDVVARTWRRLTVGRPDG